ncbi:MAG: DUF3048 domain-containing protein [Clostridiales bacterium]|nr:DUF3048 domain-containing protein [Clostridiales bacterium]
MKRIAVFLAVFCIVMFSVSSVTAKYYTLPAENQIILQDVPDRMIRPVGADDAGRISANPVIAGESPVTGLPWSGRYLPMMVMINNVEGGVDKFAPWGVQYADITYETLHTRDGVTRMVLVFSDTIPDSVGPVRSTRHSAIMIHSEWQAGFVFWGGPKVINNNIVEFFIETDIRRKGILFDGVGVASGVPPERLWNCVQGVISSSNVNVNLSGIRDLIAADYVAPARPFLFTDERLYDDRASVHRFSLDYGNGGNFSHFDYDETTDSYMRTVDVDGETQQYMAYPSSDGRRDRNEDEMILLTYRNVIVQRTEYSFANNHGSMPLMEAVGSGNADIFIGGRYIPGYWVRTDLDSPTYYFDEYGNQIVLSRGKTFIALLPGAARLGYQAAE